MLIRIGTRSSKLAVIQAENVVNSIKKIFYDANFEIVKITTSGDRITDRPLYDIGGKALFLKELEIALIENKIDIAVHSMKDVPAKIHSDLEIASITEREDPSEVLISKLAKSIYDLPSGCVIGTSSMRRIAQIKNIRNDIKFVPLRGNVQTRIDAVLEDKIGATILASAGIKRLKIELEHINKIQQDVIIPAVGQGAIACQIRKGDEKYKKICELINDSNAYNLVMAERGFLEHLDADCKTPLAASASLDDNGNIKCKYFLSNESFSLSENLEQTFDVDYCYEASVEVAKKMALKIPDYKVKL
jgi:hydroxymethylbilane synthase